MSVLDLQRKHNKVFDIRLGEKQGNRPAKLTGKLRVTSPNPDVVDAFIACYGGQRQQWNDIEWEAYLPITSLPIMVLPGQSVTQGWELYRGGVRDRHCQGTGGIEMLSGKPCMCNADVDERIADKNQCSITTRLNFLCPEVAVVGAGSLVTRGKIAAETLPNAVSVAEAALQRGLMVPATLRAVQKVGKNRQYVVPQIEIVGVSLNQLTSGDLPAELQGGEATEKSRSLGPSGGVSQPASTDRSRASVPAQVVEPAALPAPSSKASVKERNSLQKAGAEAGVFGDALEELILEKTGKYADEADFSTDDVAKVLAALENRG